MKNKLRFFIASLLILVLGLSTFNSVEAQCTVNPPSNNVGFYPDPAPPGCVGQYYDTVVQFVFPLDTTVPTPFGTFVIPFDSFRIDSFTQVPTGVAVTPNSTMYYPISATVSARGCATVIGTPTAPTVSPNDSVIAYVTAWVTAPFVGVQGGQTEFKLGFKVNDSPQASYTQTASLNVVTFTNTTTGSGITSWLWDFGDGSTSTLQNPGSHTYPAGNGTYYCCLIADNGNCADTSCTYIIVGCPAPSVNFSTNVNQLSVLFTDQTPGSSTGWLWDFGDGNTSTQQSPSHTYAAAGNYTVCLTVTNACGTDSSCKTVSPCNLPVAGFTNSASNLVVSFTDASTSGSGITSRFWDFGDGGTSTQASPSHTYGSPGTYTVCLTVTDGCGTDSSCATLVVSCAPGIANFTWNANQGVVTFTNTTVSSNNPTYSWNFGDGSGTSTQSSPSHTYLADGTYNVCLTMTDNCGTNTFCDSVQIVLAGLEEEWYGQVSFFPNPANEMVSLRLEAASTMQVELRLLDVLGQEVRSLDLGQVSGLYERQINLAGLPAGFYFVELRSEQGKASFKLVKE